MNKKLILFALLVITLNNTGFSQSAEKVTIFPNPATSVINILGLKNTSQASIIITDIYGSTVINYKWEIKKNALNIPIANLNQGIYLLSIKSEEEVIQKKFYKK
ncbi:T9SS type A sorting domain-containing protein [Maribacter sp. CXY002]|uniref:T9SS type A sorting domain-containing protein n=1 Tax=Maribacter luteocoastalis TaxID=3407671 RepID=UPI003B6786CC